MIFRRHRKSNQPLPATWRSIIAEVFVPWRFLDESQKGRLEVLTADLIDRKHWEGSKDFSVTTEMKVTIAVHAALLILELDHRYYRKVSSIIVLPTTQVLNGQRTGPAQGVVTDTPMPIIGQAVLNGPVVIAWDAASNQARHPERGHNVTYHEFAHKLDMLDGSADGSPPLSSQEEAARWVEVCQREFDLLRDGRGGHLLDAYGSVNPGEFFAVATEVFFNKPRPMLAHKPDLYGVLSSFYNQDPAQR
jgi:hypothetical protein